ncbi:MAG: ISNCY family transposase [Lactococcus lactis]
MDNENKKYKMIKDFVDKGLKNKDRLCVSLNLSIRQVNRLIERYKEKGKAGFIHGNRERKPANTYSAHLKQELLERYQKEFCFETHAYNFSHFVDELKKEGMDVPTAQTIRNWAYEADILSPKARRNTKKTKKKELKARKKQHKPLLQKLEKEALLSTYHPRKPRAKYIGELIQMDASEYIFFGSEKSTLHLAIDDASGQIVGAAFDKQETLRGYYLTFEMILKNHGIPACFLTDNRTVFNYESKKMSPEHDTRTQFAYACEQLGVEIRTTSVAQKKGRVERLNQSLQDRLTSELMRAEIQTMDEAQNFLTEFIKRYNEQFALDTKNIDSVFESEITPEKINETLAVISQRQIDSGNAIRYFNAYYQPYKDNQLVCLTPKKKILVIKALDGRLYLSDDHEIYTLRKLQEHRKISKDFDLVEASQNNTKAIYRPEMTHPWKRASFNRYLIKTNQKREKQNDFSRSN